MIVKNEYIKIKSDKEITITNYIYDKYLEFVAKAQYDKSYMDFSMIRCYLKFDTAFDDVDEKETTDFDMTFPFSNRNITTSENTVEANYTFTPTENTAYDPNTYEYFENFDNIIGKKITAIGFSTVVNYNEYIVACVDTSNYSTYFVENISFQRKDIFTSDTTVKDGTPINLTPFSNKTIVEDSGHGYTSYYCYPVLYSIGLGTRRGEMEEEYIIGEDVDVIVESDTSFGFNLRKGLETNKYPLQTIYAGNNLYPLPLNVNKELHPHNKLYTGSGIVPLLSDYKYIMYKYRYYYYHDFMDDYIDLDEYFVTNLPNDTKGLFEIVTKIERSDV